MKVLTTRTPVIRRDVISVMEVMDVQTCQRTTLFELDYLIEAPNWTPDGKYLVYNSGGLIYTYDLDANTHSPVESGFVDACNNDHVLSPDGKQIAVSHQTAEDRLSRIYSLPLSGGTPVLITPIAPSYLHGWSPDGKTLAYCAERNDEYDIYSIPAGGGVETQLTTAKGLSDGPEYSPCGAYIWFNSVRTGLMQIWRMSADGSEQTQMTFHDDLNSWFAHLSPDGKKAVYISYRKGDVDPSAHPAHKNVQIRMMDADGTNDHSLTALFGGQGTINVNSWSPDSRKIAFVSYRLKE